MTVLGMLSSRPARSLRLEPLIAFCPSLHRSRMVHRRPLSDLSYKFKDQLGFDCYYFKTPENRYFSYILGTALAKGGPAGVCAYLALGGFAMGGILDWRLLAVAPQSAPSTPSGMSGRMCAPALPQTWTKTLRTNMCASMWRTSRRSSIAMKPKSAAIRRTTATSYLSDI